MSKKESRKVTKLFHLTQPKEDIKTSKIKEFLLDLKIKLEKTFMTISSSGSAKSADV